MSCREYKSLNLGAQRADGRRFTGVDCDSWFRTAKEQTPRRELNGAERVGMTPTAALRSIQRPERLHGKVLQQLRLRVPKVNAMTIRFEKWMLILFASVAAGGRVPAFAGGDARTPEIDSISGVAESSSGVSVMTSLGSLPLVFEQNAGQS